MWILKSLRNYAPLNKGVQLKQLNEIVPSILVWIWRDWFCWVFEDFRM